MSVRTLSTKMVSLVDWGLGLGLLLTMVRVKPRDIVCFFELKLDGRSLLTRWLRTARLRDAIAGLEKRCLYIHAGTTKLLWRRLGATMHRGSSAPVVRAALVCAGPVLVGLAQIQLARQQEYAADRSAVSGVLHLRSLQCYAKYLQFLFALFDW